MQERAGVRPVARDAGAGRALPATPLIYNRSGMRPALYTMIA
jgi:hypothetical protein